jgi:hypothetical protein
MNTAVDTRNYCSPPQKEDGEAKILIMTHVGTLLVKNTAPS